MKAVAVLPGKKDSIHPPDLRARDHPEDWLSDTLSYKIPAGGYRRLSVLRERTLRVEKHEANARPHVSDPTGITAEELAGLRFFEGVPGWALERLARSATTRGFEQGAIVVQQNDEARAVYFLLSGAVQILVYFEGVGDLLMGVQRDRGSLIAGWSAFRPPFRHTSSMRCEETSELVRLPRETFEEIFEDDPYLGYQILKKVAVAVDHWLEGAVTILLETPYIPDQA
jgi:Cyclic nucleotide-binding domain